MKKTNFLENLISLKKESFPSEKSTFLKGAILPPLLRFAIPIILSLFLQALYGACDLWAVGTFGSSYDMSAVSTSSQVMLILNGFMTGIATGTTVLLGIKYGEKNYQEAREVFAGTFWIIAILSIVITFILVNFSKDISILANAPEQALSQTTSYLKICGMGTVFILSYNGISGIFRGVGNSFLPLIFVVIACISNIIGDIILIEFFHLGATGAAISTVFAQALSVVLSIIFIKRYDFKFKINRLAFLFKPNAIIQIMKLGLPIALLQMSNEIYYLILIGFVNKLGVIAGAGVGVAEKLIVFLVLIPLSYMSALSSFVSHNIGAKQEKRAKEGLFTTLKLSSIMGFVIAAMLFFYGRDFSTIFNSNPEILNISGLFLKATSLECFILSISYCFTGYFNGLKKTNFVMIQGFFVIFCVKIPYAYFAMKYLNHKLINLGISTVLGALVSLILCGGYYFYLSKRKYGTI